MQLHIEAGKDTFEIKLSVFEYERIWRDYGQAIEATFYNLTGLRFMYETTNARVLPEDYGNAGNRYQKAPIILPGFSHEFDYQVVNLTHELAHRLLLDNLIFSEALGLSTDNSPPEIARLFDHRFSYLFQYDAVLDIFGENCATECARREKNIVSPEYGQAWDWAMALDFDERQHALKRIISLATPASERGDFRLSKVETIPDPDAWFNGVLGGI